MSIHVDLSNSDPIPKAIYDLIVSGVTETPVEATGTKEAYVKVAIDFEIRGGDFDGKSFRQYCVTSKTGIFKLRELYVGLGIWEEGVALGKRSIDPSKDLKGKTFKAEVESGVDPERGMQVWINSFIKSSTPLTSGGAAPSRASVAGGPPSR